MVKFFELQLPGKERGFFRADSSNFAEIELRPGEIVRVLSLVEQRVNDGWKIFPSVVRNGRALLALVVATGGRICCLHVSTNVTLMDAFRRASIPVSITDLWKGGG